MKRSDRNARNRNTLTDLQCLAHPHWQAQLEFYATKGYPTGGDGNHSNDISRPTERLALTPDTPPARKQKRLLELEAQLADLAREVHAIHIWTITTAKYDGPEPRPCTNLDCTHTITMIGNDIARKGLCNRCATAKYRNERKDRPAVA